MKRKNLIFFIILVISINGISQTASIFSDNGLGLGLASQYLSTRSMGMGNAGIATSDSMNLNLYNYSKWADLKYTVVQAGFNTERNNYELNQNKGHLQNSGFTAFMLAIPLKAKKIVFFANLFPMNHLSFNGYEVVKDSSTFDREFFLTRKGTTTQINFGFAAQINPNLYQALHLAYILGAFNDEYKVFFDNSTLNDIAYKYEYTLGLVGVGYSGQINYRRIGIGYYFNKFFNGSFKKIIRRPYDFTKRVSTSYSTSLPFEAGVGLSYNIANGWRGAIDFNYKNYSAGVPTFLSDESVFEDYAFIHTGLEKFSKAHPFMPIIKRLDWRLGAFYGKEGYKVNNESLQSFGFTLGMGIPLNAAGSKVDLAIQIGKRGSLKNNNKEETFIKLGVGFKTFEKWFHRFNR